MDVFSLSYVRTFRLLLLFVIGYFLGFCLYPVYRNINHIIVLVLIMNYIFSSSYSMISNYTSEVNVLFRHYKKFEQYLFKKVLITLSLINLPFLILFINHTHYLDLFFMTIFNHFLSIKNYSLLERVYFYDKSKIFPNKIALGIISLIPYLCIINFIIFIYFDRKTKKYA